MATAGARRGAVKRVVVLVHRPEHPPWAFLAIATGGASGSARGGALFCSFLFFLPAKRVPGSLTETRITTSLWPEATGIARSGDRPGV